MEDVSLDLPEAGWTCRISNKVKASGQEAKKMRGDFEEDRGEKR